MTSGHCSSDRGSATVAMAGVLAVVVTIALAIAGLAGASRDRADARAAADLAALAGAYSARGELTGEPVDPCAAAGRAAAANAAELTRCRAWGDGSVQVTVASGGAQASARAGPQGAGQKR